MQECKLKEQISKRGKLPMETCSARHYILLLLCKNFICNYAHTQLLMIIRNVNNYNRTCDMI